MQNSNLRKDYTKGFILSLALTLLAYMVVVGSLLSGWVLGLVVAALAVSQLLVQLVYFLHLGRRDSDTRWQRIMFISAVVVILVLVFGSIWIMNNLRYNMSHDGSVEQEIIKDELVE